MRAIVVGAGFAGLACADRLIQLGHEVVVLESRNRVGGRVWSQPLVPGDDDTVIERGAEFLLDGYDTLHGMLRRFNLTAAPTTMSYYVREPRGTTPPVTAEVVAAAARSLNAAVQAANPHISLRDFLDTHPQFPTESQVLAARAAISWATSETELSVKVLLGAAASVQPLPTARVAGGNQRIATALAAELGDRVRFLSPVVGVHAIDQGVEVRTKDDVLRAERVVLTVPLPLLETLDIQPGLPQTQRDAMARLGRGHAAKLHAPVHPRPAASAVLDVPNRFWCWTATDGSGQVQPVVHCFSGSPGALAGLRVDAGTDTWLAALQALRPDLTISAEHALLTTWDDDPWATFAYSSLSVAAKPGDEELIRLPHGRIHIAGEHTAGEWAGLMEGALRSGLRAAEEMHHREGSALTG